VRSLRRRRRGGMARSAISSVTLTHNRFVARLTLGGRHEKVAFRKVLLLHPPRRTWRMRRVAIAGLVLLVLSASVIAGCGGSSESSSGSADLTLWTGFTDRELGVMKDVIADFEKTHPDIHVKVVGGISDDKIVAAIRGGN